MAVLVIIKESFLKALSIMVEVLAVLVIIALDIFFAVYISMYVGMFLNGLGIFYLNEGVMIGVKAFCAAFILASIVLFEVLFSIKVWDRKP